jgi:hypothetical protein
VGLINSNSSAYGFSFISSKIFVMSTKLSVSIGWLKYLRIGQDDLADAKPGESFCQQSAIARRCLLLQLKLLRGGVGLLPTVKPLLRLKIIWLEGGFKIGSFGNVKSNLGSNRQ